MISAKVTVLDDAEAVARGGAERFVALAAQKRNAPFTVALSGGSTPRRMFELLAAPPLRDRVDWSRVIALWGDERPVPPDHPDSNYGMARDALLSKVPIPSANVHRMEAERSDRDAAAEEYEALVRRVAPGDPPVPGDPPAIDLLLQGMGENGHTASLFPHTAALSERARLVVPNWVPELSTWRMTFTYPLINAGANVLFVVTGANKADMLRQVLEGPGDPARLPSQGVRPTGGRLEWLVDRAAAAGLSSALK